MSKSNANQHQIRKADPIDRHVGKRLRLRRSMMGISQEKLAAAIGISFQQLQKYEQGINRISASRLYDLCQALNISISFLFKDIEQSEEMQRRDKPYLADLPKSNIDDDDDILHRTDTLVLVRNFWRINDQTVQKQILNLLKTLGHSYTELLSFDE